MSNRLNEFAVRKNIKLAFQYLKLVHKLCLWERDLSFHNSGAHFLINHIH